MNNAIEVFQNNRKASNLRLWYSHPATTSERSYSGSDDGDWQNKCLPIGNGYMGAMLAGEICHEKIQFNEKTLWTGGPSKLRPDYNGGNFEGRAEKLKEVQALLLAKQIDEATEMAREHLVGDYNGYGAYQNFGWVTVSHEFEGGEFSEEKLSDYVRELDLNTATAATSFSYDGVGYMREYFMSYPHNVMAVKYSSTDKNKITLFVEGVSAHELAESSVRNDVIVLKGALTDNQLRYEAQIKIISIGGTISAKSAGVAVSGADEVVILMSAATDFKNEYPAYRSGIDTSITVSKNIKNAVDAGFEKLLRNHISDYQKIFSRVSFNVCQEVSGDATDVLLSKYKNSASLAELEVLLFHYGRYLTIASSRNGSLPSNLQGVWNETNNPPWGCDYHLNINLQMNYWPVYVTNMAECATPLIDYVESLRIPGRVTAKEYMGIISDEANPENGFTAHTQNTPFGWTCPGWSFEWGWSPAAVPWLLQNVWDFYRFSMDKTVLREKIYPMMKEQCKFWQQYLLLDKNNSMYYSAPAYSPEHGPITLGNTYEHTLVKQLLMDSIVAADILGVDDADRAQWERLAACIETVSIGEEGQIKEWFDEITIRSMPQSELKHRHLSHLLGLFPGDSISIQTPELLKAAVVSLNDRGDISTGWGIVHRINMWARVQDGERTHALIRQLISTGIHENLFDTHPPFQIDGNFGYTSGVAEMLFQSNLGYIHILPSLPKVWEKGSVSGLVARGNFEIGMTWDNCMVNSVTVLSNVGGDCVLKFKNISKLPKVCYNGLEVPTNVIDGETISFQTVAGCVYEVR